MLRKWCGKFNLRGKKTMQLTRDRRDTVVNRKEAYEAVRVKKEELDLATIASSTEDIQYSFGYDGSLSALSRDEWMVEERDGKVRIYSSNFTHDAALELTGDFINTRQKYEYAKFLSKLLNEGYLLNDEY